MRTKGFKITILGLIYAIALSIGFGCGAFFNSEQLNVASAAEVTQNTTLNVSEIRIDGWRALQDMTTYGRNFDSGCGMTAMAVLLQYYNDNSLYAGDILPDEFDYNQDTTETGGYNTYANWNSISKKRNCTLTHF